ncbi:MAG: glycosyltransferase family 4 protein [Acidobacteriota bacterium]|nr:glycosyltransferase family 4 protein [Acidobacteriota bacterium]
MKIAFLTMLASAQAGPNGVRTSVRELGRGLKAAGHEVVVVTCGPPGETVEGDLRVMHVGEVPQLQSMWRALSPRFVWQRLRYMVLAARAIRRLDPDVVEVPEGGFEHFFLLFRRPCPIVVRLHGNVSSTLSRTMGSRALEFVEAFTTRLADGISSPSRAYAERIAADYRIDVDRIRIVANGVDIGALDARAQGGTALRRTYGLGDRTLVLFTGAVTARKGARQLCEVARQLVQREDTVFVVAGPRGHDALKIDFPDNVVESGEVSRTEVCRLCREAAVFIMPSRFENLSMSLLEALSFELPVVAFDVGGNAELVKDGENGFLIPWLNTDLMAAQVSLLLDDVVRRQTMGQASRALVESRFSRRRVVGASEAFYQESRASWAARQRSGIRSTYRRKSSE